MNQKGDSTSYKLDEPAKQEDCSYSSSKLVFNQQHNSKLR